MNDQIKRYLDNLPKEFKPIVDRANKYYSFDNKADVRSDGAVQIFNRTWVVPENYGLLLFQPVENKLMDKFEKLNKLKMPKSYKRILSVMNGCFVYDFALYGLPASLYSRGLLDRTTLGQFDLGAANQFWKYEYETDTDDLFHIGGRVYSFEENIGYFINPDDKIVSLRKNGEILKIWANFSEFLQEEIYEAEKMMLGEMPKKSRTHKRG